ncbi:TPA: hypothetical protein U9M35_002952 [Acinetobacter baumannii]|nr:hypothetical protein [Acinetobacter baumannii]
MITADAQLGIAKYLHGGTYANQRVFDRLDLYETFEPLGLHVMGTRTSEIQDRVKEYCTVEAQRSMEENGLNVHSVCKGCANFDEKTDVCEESLSEKIFFRSILSCRRGGCDKAREQFIENVAKMERYGRSAIDLHVEVESSKSEIHYCRFGEEVYEAYTMPPIKGDRIKIHAERKKPIDYSDFFSVGEIASYSKPKPEPKRSLDEIEKVREKKKKELESELEFLMKNEMGNYDVEVW